MENIEVGPGASLKLVSAEVRAVLESGSLIDSMALDRVSAQVLAAPRVFVLGAGRSGLALRMTAMRLMHLGLEVHVVGEATTPAIVANDLLLVASGSGTTSSIVRAARTAVDVGASVVAITTDGSSPLAREAGSSTLLVPAAGKLDRSSAVSAQYAGSLFEQCTLLIGDALFHTLWMRSGQDADELWLRHSNLE